MLTVFSGGGGPCTPHCEVVLAHYLRRPTVDLSCSKTDGVTERIAGQTVTYTIVVGNSEPNAVVGAMVTDPLPGAITGATWTCAITGGGSCASNGTGGISDTLTLLIGATATYTLTATIDIAATGALVNTATVATPAGQTDLEATNDSATDVDVLVPAADLAITKADGLERVAAGSPVTYTIVAGNAGPNPVAAARVTDAPPGALTGAAWTCAGAGGGIRTPSGTGGIDDAVTLPVGGSVTYSLTGTVSPSNTSAVTNTATVAVTPGLGVGDPIPGTTARRTSTSLPETSSTRSLPAASWTPAGSARRSVAPSCRLSRPGSSPWRVTAAFPPRPRPFPST